MKFVFSIIINTLVIFFIAKFILPGFKVNDFLTAFWVAIVLALVNVTIKPLLLILTLPINILSLGLFTFVVNALMLEIVSLFVKGFDISSFGTAFLGALIISLTHLITRDLEIIR